MPREALLHAGLVKVFVDCLQMNFQVIAEARLGARRGQDESATLVVVGGTEEGAPVRDAAAVETPQQQTENVANLNSRTGDPGYHHLRATPCGVILHRLKVKSYALALGDGDVHDPEAQRPGLVQPHLAGATNPPPGEHYGHPVTKSSVGKFLLRSAVVV
eukprot:3146403-Rhodomonas_salina.1